MMTAALGSRGLRLRSISAALLAMGLVVGCGGGGGASSSSTTMQPSSAFAAQCVAPRSAGTIDPFTGQPYGDRAGSASTEKSWVRSWIDETYLWYDEVPDHPAANYADAVRYFDVLHTNATTASGKAKDQFHFTYSTPEWVALAQSGIELGYGIEWVAISTSPPRRFVVAFTEPGTQAATTNVTRGDELITVDGIDFVNSSGPSQVDALNNALFPSSSATSHTFALRTLGGGTRTVTLTPANVTRTPVQNVKVLQTASGKVGYLQFNDHIATVGIPADPRNQSAQGSRPLTDLVLDIRYNGGGFLDIASELAYMIAGQSPHGRPARSSASMFNDKHRHQSGHAARRSRRRRSTPRAGLLCAPASTPLPTLNLAACLRAHGQQHVLGERVHHQRAARRRCAGDPDRRHYVRQALRLLPTDNCGTTYFSIQFHGVNAKSFGDYADGFVPAGTATNGVPGCAVADDFTHAIGDPAEARFAAALGYRVNGSCPPATSTSREASLSLRSSLEPLCCARQCVRTACTANGKRVAPRRTVTAMSR